MVKIKSSGQRGYTLLELMIAGMLSMIVLLALELVAAPLVDAGPAVRS